MPHRRPVVSVAANAVRTSFSTALALGALAVAACNHSGPRQDDPNAFVWNGDLAAPGTVLIRNTSGAITVEPSPDAGVHVRAATSWTRGDPKKDIDFRVVTAASTVTVCAVWNNGACNATDYSSGQKKNGISFGWSSKSDASVAFTVQVPAGVRVDVTTVEGRVNVRASAPVKARSIDGNVMVGTSVGPVDAETINGDVDVRMTTLGDAGAVRAVTKNGSATAWVPEITDGKIESSTLNGELGSDFGSPSADGVGHMRELKATIGAGTRPYEIQTLNGAAWLRLINADGSIGPQGGATPSAAPKTAKSPASRKRTM